MRGIIVGIALFFALPVVAYAQLDGALVSCIGPYCQLCDLVTTLNNVIRFAVALSVVVATLMFTYAGALYVTASANEGNIKKAHGIFTKVFIGLIIILLSWLIVDIIMKVFLSGNFGPWNEVQCSPWPGGQGYEANLALSPFSQPLVNSSGGTFVPSGGSCSNVAAGPCTPEALTPTFGVNAEGFSKVCQRESGGNPNLASKTDVLWCGQQCPGREGQNIPFSFGAFQNNIATDEIFCPGAISGASGVPSRSYTSSSLVSGTAYNCASSEIWNPPPDPNKSIPCFGTTCTAKNGWGKTVKNWNLYDKCAAIAKDFSCSAETARYKAVDQARGFSPWVLARDACGLQFQ